MADVPIPVYLLYESWECIGVNTDKVRYHYSDGSIKSVIIGNDGPCIKDQWIRLPDNEP